MCENKGVVFLQNKYKILKYSSYIKRIIFLCVIPWIVPVLHLIAKDSNEPFEWIYILFPIIFSSVFVFIMWFCRRFSLGALARVELDWHKFYELEKHGSDCDLHNQKILINVNFYDGNFGEVISCADKILQMSSKPLDIELAMHRKILAMFIDGRTENLHQLIKQRKNNVISKKSNKWNFLYYDFIEKFLEQKYEESIEVFTPLIQSDEFKVFNDYKVLVYYFMRLAYLKLEDLEKANFCAKEILSADKFTRTFFAKSLIDFL